MVEVSQEGRGMSGVARRRTGTLSARSTLREGDIQRVPPVPASVAQAPRAPEAAPAARAAVERWLPPA